MSHFQPTYATNVGSVEKVGGMNTQKELTNARLQTPWSKGVNSMPMYLSAQADSGVVIIASPRRGWDAWPLLKNFHHFASGVEVTFYVTAEKETDVEIWSNNSADPPGVSERCFQGRLLAGKKQIIRNRTGGGPGQVKFFTTMPLLPTAGSSARTNPIVEFYMRPGEYYDEKMVLFVWLPLGGFLLGAIVTALGWAFLGDVLKRLLGAIP